MARSLEFRGNSEGGVDLLLLTQLGQPNTVLMSFSSELIRVLVRVMEFDATRHVPDDAFRFERHSADESGFAYQRECE